MKEKIKNQCPFCKKMTPVPLDEHSCRTKRTWEKYGHLSDSIETLLKDGHSVLHIVKNSQELLGEPIEYKHVGSIMTHKSVKLPSIKDAANSEKTRAKYKKTVEEIYGPGIHNVSQSDIVKKKKEDTNLKKFGVRNSFERPDSKDSIVKTMISKYGVRNAIHMPNRKGTSGKLSNPHKKVSEFLNSIGIHHENEKSGIFEKFNDGQSRIYSPIPDIWLADAKIVIEIFGDRWHMNPKKYKETDVVKLYEGSFTASQVWEKDKARISHMESFGVHVIVIWEDTIKNDFEQLTEFLKEKLNASIQN